MIFPTPSTRQIKRTGVLTCWRIHHKWPHPLLLQEISVRRATHMLTLTPCMTSPSTRARYIRKNASGRCIRKTASGRCIRQAANARYIWKTRYSRVELCTMNNLHLQLVQGIWERLSEQVILERCITHVLTLTPWITLLIASARYLRPFSEQNISDRCVTHYKLLHHERLHVVESVSENK